MTYFVIFQPEAETEFLDSIIWYEKILEGLGRDFQKETEKIVHHLELHPFIYTKKKKNFREAVVRRFPYVIVYKILPKKKEVHILSVFHTSRHPKKKYIGH
ncbi:MAG: type II toxin-antitoxin system RelE/ParE family toxin [Bacteroidota bacterium]